MNTNEITIILGIGAALASVAGFLSSNLFKEPTSGFQGGLYGLAAGLIGGIAMFELFPPALAMGSVNILVLGGLLGTGFMFLIDYFYNIPTTMHPEKVELLTKTGIMVAVGIAIHNLVESFSFGLGYNSGFELMIKLALGMTVHNFLLGLTLGVMLKYENRIKRSIIIGVPTLASITGMLIGLNTAKIEITQLAYAMSLALAGLAYISITKLLPRAVVYHKIYGWTAFFIGIGVLKIFTLFL